MMNADFPIALYLTIILFFSSLFISFQLFFLDVFVHK